MLDQNSHKLRFTQQTSLNVHSRPSNTKHALVGNFSHCSSNNSAIDMFLRCCFFTNNSSRMNLNTALKTIKSDYWKTKPVVQWQEKFVCRLSSWNSLTFAQCKCWSFIRNVVKQKKKHSGIVQTLFKVVSVFERSRIILSFSVAFSKRWRLWRRFHNTKPLFWHNSAFSFPVFLITWNPPTRHEAKANYDWNASRVHGQEHSQSLPCLSFYRASWNIKMCFDVKGACCTFY